MYGDVEVQFHAFSTKTESRRLCVLAASSLGKQLAVSIGYEFVWAPEPGYEVAKRKIFCSYWEQNSNHTVSNLVKILTDFA
jgi:hypothetical protein